MNPIHWFEIPVNDIDRAKKFYEDVLGVRISLKRLGALEMGWFHMENNVYGATGSLVKAENYVPSHTGALVYFAVPDIEAVIERIKQNGGKVLMPQTSLREYGFIAHFEDSEGNRVALHSND